MNKFVIIIFVCFQTLLVNATQPDTLPATNNEKSIVTNSSFELLYNQSEAIKLTGEVRAGDKLKAIIEDAAAYLGNSLDRLFSFGDDDDEADAMPTNVNGLSYECNKSEAEAHRADCMLSVTYKSGEKAVLHFSVSLNSNPNASSEEKLTATAILNNQVAITRTPAPK